MRGRSVLKRLFEKSRFAISTEETRYYLNGVYMHVAEGGGRAAACAASRPTGTGWRVIDAALPDGAAEAMPGVIVPRKAVDRAQEAAVRRRGDAAIGVAVSRDQGAILHRRSIALTSKVIDGTFPDYSRVIPTRTTPASWKWTRPSSPAPWTASPPSARERSRAVKMSMDDDRLVLSVNAPDSGAAEEEIGVAYGDEKLEIGFNAKYLLEIAGQVDRENAVFLFNSVRRSRR